MYLQRNIYSRQLCHIEWEGIEWARELLFSGKYTGGSGIQKRWYILADEITRTNDHLLCICSYFLFVQAHGGISAGTCCSMLLLLRKRIISKTNLASLLLYAIALRRAGCHFTHQTDTFPVCSIGNKLPISIIFWLVDQREKNMIYFRIYLPLCVLK